MVAMLFLRCIHMTCDSSLILLNSSVLPHSIILVLVNVHDMYIERSVVIFRLIFATVDYVVYICLILV